MGVGFLACAGLLPGPGTVVDMISPYDAPFAGRRASGFVRACHSRAAPWHET
jgi:hypothetical protein